MSYLMLQRCACYCSCLGLEQYSTDALRHGFLLLPRLPDVLDFGEAATWPGRVTWFFLGCVSVQEPEKKRHLLRLWLEPEESRPLPHYYEDLKGGIKVNGAKLYVPLNAED